MPNLHAMEERIDSGFKISPSISADFNTSNVNVSKMASPLISKPRDSILPNNLPCRFLASLSTVMILSLTQKKLG